MLTTTLQLTAAGLATAALLGAQNPPTVGLEIPRDPLSGMGMGMILAGDSEIQRRLPNDAIGPMAPFTPSTNGRPHYVFFGSNAVFDAADAAHIVVDAMSTGNDVLPIQDVDDRIGFPGGPGGPTGIPSWVNVVMSLAPGASNLQGIPGLRAQSNDISADLYSYWFEGNQGTGPEFIDESYLVDGHEHLPLAETDDILALDVFMQWLADNSPDGGIVRTDNQLYFSVTSASANWLTQGTSRLPYFAEYTPSMSPGEIDTLKNKITGATIFKSVWDGSAWGKIEFELLPENLVNDGEPLPKEVDAIAYDAKTYSPASAQKQTLLYSETEASLQALQTTRSQLRLVVIEADPTAPTGKTYRASDAKNGQGVDLRIPTGIRDGGDPDAICTEDPEGVLSQFHGAPVAFQDPVDFGLKVERAVTPGTSNNYLAIQVHNLRSVRAALPGNHPGGLIELVFWEAGSMGQPVTVPARIPMGMLPLDDDSLQMTIGLGNNPAGGVRLHFHAVFEPADGEVPTMRSWHLEIKF